VSRPPKYIKATEASKLLGITITEFLDGVKNGSIPQPVFMGHGNRWLEEELKDARSRCDTTD